MKEKIKIVFRKMKEGDIIALFPFETQWDREIARGVVQSYMHVGQHGMADISHILDSSVPASSEEYKDLYDELTKCYYDRQLEVINNYNVKKYIQVV